MGRIKLSVSLEENLIRLCVWVTTSLTNSDVNFKFSIVIGPVKNLYTVYGVPGKLLYFLCTSVLR